MRLFLRLLPSPAELKHQPHNMRLRVHWGLEPSLQHHIWLLGTLWSQRWDSRTAMSIFGSPLMRTRTTLDAEAAVGWQQPPLWLALGQWVVPPSWIARLHRAPGAAAPAAGVLCALAIIDGHSWLPHLRVPATCQHSEWTGSECGLLSTIALL